MARDDNKDEKAARLADQLRANLRRRKQQARAMKDLPERESADSNPHADND